MVKIDIDKAVQSILIDYINNTKQTVCLNTDRFIGKQIPGNVYMFRLDSILHNDVLR